MPDHHNPALEALEQEGIVKFILAHQQRSLTDCEYYHVDSYLKLDRWRHIQHRLGFIGQKPDRYDGYGFGNISLRLCQGRDEFLISGTQTGAPPFLNEKDYAAVTLCDPMTNTIHSIGEIKPSSEAMTHGQLYQLDPEIMCVIHVHSPEIWQRSNALNLAVTAADVLYGTPQMAKAVSELFARSEVKQKRIFTMAGHFDGVIGFGRNFNEATSVLCNYLAKALMLP